MSTNFPPSDPETLVVPVNRVIYKDGTQECFVKSFTIRRNSALQRYEFVDRSGQMLTRPDDAANGGVLRIEDTRVCYGLGGGLPAA